MEVGIHTSTDSLQSTQQCNQVEEEDSHFASDCSEMNLQPQIEDFHSTSDAFQQLHSAVGDHQETQSEKFDLSKELKSWASEENISHVAVKRLLNILKKHPCHSNLPSDPRTLLGTPRCISNQFRVVKPGLYFSFGLEKQLIDVVNRLSTHSTIPQDLLIFVNVDGLPAVKSAGSELWPILGSLPQFTHVQPFEIGLYHGPKKPSGSNDYLKDFINELENEGIVIGGRKINVSIGA